MSTLLYRIINPIVKALLRSPLHGVMSGNTLIIEFTGRKSGRSLSTPISYWENEGRVHAFTSKASKWWLNLQNEAQVHLVIKGKRIATVAHVESEDLETIIRMQTAFLRAVPRDAQFAGVRLDENGEPNADDIRANAGEMVYLNFGLGQ